MDKTVVSEKRGAVLDVVLNRGDRLNAMIPQMFTDLKAAFAAAADPAVRAVLLWGEGKAFSVGGDIRELARISEASGGVPPEMPNALHATIERLRTLPKPVLAAVQGPCAGAGMSLMLACDLAIAADNCKFNLAYAGIGLSPDGGASFFLPRHVGFKRAMEIFLTGKTMTADELLHLGLINRVVRADDLLNEARQMADRLAMGPTLAFAKVKELINASYTNNLHDQLALETKLFCASSRTADFRSGVKAFLAKKMPKFDGT